MSERAFAILVFNILMLILVLRLVFKSFREVRKALYYLIKPNILSIIQNDYNNDFNYTHRFLLATVIMVVLILIQFVLFY